MDPRNEAAFGTWFDVVDASLTHQRPGEPHRLAGELRTAARRRLGPDPVEAGPLLVCLDGRTLVGAARLTLPLRARPLPRAFSRCTRPTGAEG